MDHSHCTETIEEEGRSEQREVVVLYAKRIVISRRERKSFEVEKALWPTRSPANHFGHAQELVSPRDTDVEMDMGAETGLIDHEEDQVSR